MTAPDLAGARPESAAESIRTGLEAVLVTLVDARGGGGAQRSVSEAVACLSRFVEAPESKNLAELGRACQELEAAVASLAAEGRAAASLGSLGSWLKLTYALALDQLSSRRVDPGGRREQPADAPAAGPELRASVGVPRAHDLPVPPPRVLPQGEPDPDDPSPLATEESVVSGDVAQLAAVARDAFEDLASFGSLRLLADHEPWSDAAGFEQRLLDNLDAVVALDHPRDPAGARLGVVEALWRYATEWAVPDAGRAFALAFVLSCASSEAAMRWTVLALRRTHPSARRGFVEAFALGSNPAIDRALGDLGRDGDAAVLEVALDACARRATAPVAAAAVLASHPDVRVARRAVALAARAPAYVAVPLLRDVLDDDRPEIVATAAAALAIAGDEAGPRWLRQLLESGEDDARPIVFEALCLLGEARDRELLQSTARGAIERLAWLGWHGYTDHVPAMARAYADQRGSALGDDLAAALERIDGRRPPSPGGARFEDDLAAWLAASPRSAVRVRRGAPWSLAAVVAELEDAATRQGARRVLAREIDLASRGRFRLDVDGWVEAQRRELARVREALGARR